MKKSYKAYLIAFVALGLIGFASYRIIATNRSPDLRRQGATLVRAEKPRRENILDQLEFNGDVLPIRQAAIFSKVGGNLESVRVEMGDYVRIYQILAIIDSTELKEQVQQSSATYTTARLNYQRGRRLFEQNLMSKQDLDNLEGTMKVARSNYDLAVTRLGYARIAAPFAGFVTKRFLDPGALVNANNSTLFMLMNLDSVKIIVNVPEKQVPLIYSVKEASVTLDALPRQTFTGIVSRFSESIDLSTRTMAVNVDVPNRNHVLKPGMFATIRLVINQHPGAITLPTNALMRDDVGYFVYALVGSSARQIRVTTGIEQAGRTEIASGLKGDEDIIIAGQQFVRDGSPVTPQQ